MVDPPSFAPNRQSLPKATASYERVFAAAASLIRPAGGLLALSSCSSHLAAEPFLALCDDALAKARRPGAAVLGVHGQGADHPYPSACDELRYLKFALFRI